MKPFLLYSFLVCCFATSPVWASDSKYEEASILQQALLEAQQTLTSMKDEWATQKSKYIQIIKQLKDVAETQKTNVQICRSEINQATSSDATTVNEELTSSITEERDVLAKKVAVLQDVVDSMQPTGENEERLAEITVAFEQVTAERDGLLTQVAELQETVTELNHTVATLTDTEEMLGVVMETMAEERDALRHQVAELNQTVTELESALSSQDEEAEKASLAAVNKLKERNQKLVEHGEELTEQIRGLKDQLRVSKQSLSAVRQELHETNEQLRDLQDSSLLRAQQYVRTTFVWIEESVRTTWGDAWVTIQRVYETTSPIVVSWWKELTAFVIRTSQSANEYFIANILPFLRRFWVWFNVQCGQLLAMAKVHASRLWKSTEEWRQQVTRAVQPKWRKVRSTLDPVLGPTAEALSIADRFFHDVCLLGAPYLDVPLRFFSNLQTQLIAGVNKLSAVLLGYLELQHAPKALQSAATFVHSHSGSIVLYLEASLATWWVLSTLQSFTKRPKRGVKTVPMAQ